MFRAARIRRNVSNTALCRSRKERSVFSLPTFCYRFLFHDVYLIESVQKHAGLPNTSFPAQNDEQLQGKVCTSVRKAVYAEVRDTFQMKHTQCRLPGFAAEMRSECESLQKNRVWFCNTLDNTCSSRPYKTAHILPGTTLFYLFI